MSFVITCIDANCTDYHKFDCKAQETSTGTDDVPDDCREAKINVDWVISLDSGARQRFANFRSQGQGPLEAVISAQAHNPHAQQTIRDCSGWASRYLAKRGYGGDFFSGAGGSGSNRINEATDNGNYQTGLDVNPTFEDVSGSQGNDGLIDGTDSNIDKDLDNLLAGTNRKLRQALDRKVSQFNANDESLDKAAQESAEKLGGIERNSYQNAADSLANAANALSRNKNGSGNTGASAGSDDEEKGRQCVQISEKLVPFSNGQPQQNELLLRAACSQFCGASITAGDASRDLKRAAVSNQRSAMDLCSGPSGNCKNNINLEAKCSYSANYR